MRGTYIFLACLQHFAYYLNQFGLPASKSGLAVYEILTPSGEQLFLSLAAFNLAKRSKEDFKGVYPLKLKNFAIVFLLFFLVSFLSSVEIDDLGQSLSWKAMQSWMLILALLATLFRFFGPKAILALFVAQMLFWTLPIERYSDSLQMFIAEGLWLETFRYEARIELFIGSGCLGFLIGHLHYHGPGDRQIMGICSKELFLIATGLCLLCIFLVSDIGWEVDPKAIWEGEYEVPRHFAGIMGIWGINAALIGCALLAEKILLKRAILRQLKIPLIHFCGRYSLFAFAAHEVIFIRVVLPLRLHFGGLLGIPLENSLTELGLLACIVLSMCKPLRALLRAS